MASITAKNGLGIGTFDDDILTGSDGADLLFAGFGNDTVDAGGGNDRLDGGGGSDLLAGGAGEDVFLFRPFDAGERGSHDVIVDFNPFEDQIVFDLPGDFSHTAVSLAVLDFTPLGNNQVVVEVGNSELHINLQGFGGLDVPWDILFV